MCPVCRMLARLLFLFCGVCGVGGWRSDEKEASGHIGIVRESACLLGEGTGYGAARRGVTCSHFGGAWEGSLTQLMCHSHVGCVSYVGRRPIVDC